MKSQPLPSATGDASDLVYTPSRLAKAIIDILPLRGRILDCARGPGAFYDQYPDWCDPDWCEIADGKDFLEFDGHVDWIVTNPPWSRIRDFLTHGMKVSDNIVFLITANHLFTKARVSSVAAAGFGIRAVWYVPTPPNPWPQSGFQLACIWLKRGHQGLADIGPLPGRPQSC